MCVTISLIALLDLSCSHNVYEKYKNIITNMRKLILINIYSIFSHPHLYVNQYFVNNAYFTYKYKLCKTKIHCMNEESE